MSNAPTQGLALSTSDIQIAASAIQAVAQDFGFEAHPAEQWYRHQSRGGGVSDIEYLAAYEYSGAKEYGRIYLFLAVSKHDGDVLVMINDMDAYGPSTFIASLQQAVVSTLSKHFPERKIDVESHRGVSPLGP